MTERQKHLLRHACGVDSKQPFYRERYSANPGSPDDVEWAQMVGLGWAVVTQEPEAGQYALRHYGVTDAGKQAIAVACGIKPAVDLDQRVRELEVQLQAARGNARVLAHAYQTDNRPPPGVVAESLAYPVK
jgi:hypothetical protein